MKRRSNTVLQISVKRQQLGLVTPPQTPAKTKYANVFEQEQDKENVPAIQTLKPVIDENEHRLIQEVEYFDNKFGVKEPELELNNRVYVCGKKLFSKKLYNDCENPCLVGREKEFETMKGHIMNNITSDKSSFIYISGPPGCGKTQQLVNLLKELKKQNATKKASSGISDYFMTLKSEKSLKVSVTQFNCMQLNSFQEFYRVFLDKFGINCNNLKSYAGKYGNDIKTRLTNKEIFVYMMNSREFAANNIIFLDELDSLVDKESTQNIYEFFTLVNKKDYRDSRLTIIGIANSLNFVNKYASRLKLDKNNLVKMQFLPYTTEQIVDIVNTKLKSLVPSEQQASSLPLIHPSALQLCARKAASNTGDLRKVFDILYKALEQVETQTKKKYMANPELSVKQFNGLTFETAPKVMISHVAKICAQAFSGISSNNRLKQVNLYQCFVLICLAKLEQENQQTILISSNSKSKSITITQLFAYYKKMCSRSEVFNIALTKTEITEIASTLANFGLINIVNKVNNLNINSQSQLSCCGVTLQDLNKFLDEKYEVLKKVIKL